ncbi:hypothetical protein LCGC14_2154370 [marine sediment metagenome]|uniref:Uncharacterized protein n=1 Tax=marine sediment metagenome TaxID=412755 RepID=A0A0F9GQY6_9ZZZZ
MKQQQPKDEIFELLYRDFMDELEASNLLYVNDTAGFNRWYKERLLKLCHQYKILMMHQYLETS